QGGTFEEALRLGLRAVLCSPDFLYLKTSPGRLSDFELASRLSYFLWSTMPDDELLSLAERGALTGGRRGDLETGRRGERDDSSPSLPVSESPSLVLHQQV